MSLTEEERKLLEQAAAMRFACIDLRYEGGEYVSVLARLALRGLLISEDRGSMASYRISDEGRAALRGD